MVMKSPRLMIHTLFMKGKNIIGAIEFARDITSLEKLIYQPLRRYGEPLTFDVITAISAPMQIVKKTQKKQPMPVFLYY